MNYSNYCLLGKTDGGLDGYFENYDYGSYLKYFGGKSNLRKVLMKTVLNISSHAWKKSGGKLPIFIDAFTGGGKLGLCMPHEMFSEIVMNDLDGCMYNLYKVMKSEAYTNLIETIESICYSHDRLLLNEELETFNKYSQKIYDDIDKVEGQVNRAEIILAALYFMVLYSSYYGQTEMTASLNVRAEHIVDRAHDLMPDIHKRLQGITLTNLDYRQLIAKYNGLQYSDQTGQKHTDPARESEKVYYFDPPYYKLKLSEKEKTYKYDFSVKDTEKMTEILSGKNKNYGELNYWVKSDYMPAHDNNYPFASIEDPNTYCVFDLGSVLVGEKSAMELQTKHEYIWAKGLK
jgi:site-specific DNA-adenine methylase